MFRSNHKLTAAAAALTMIWSAAAAATAQLPVVSAVTVTPPYSCPAVYDALMAMEDEYPKGTPWTNEDFYAWNGGGMYYGGYGCVSFAYLLSDAAFGYLPCEEPLDFDPAALRVGDMIRYSGHTVVILEVCSDSVIVAEGNYDSAVNWGRKITFDSIASSVEYYSSRYPDAFAFRETEAAIAVDETVTPAVISRDAVSLTWESSDSNVAAVGTDGVVHGMGNGVATITATDGSHTESFTVTVGNPEVGTEIPKGLNYTVDTELGAVTITGYKGELTELTIPAEIEGLPVTTIGNWAFTANSPVTHLVLPDTVTTLSSFAFFDSRNLQSIVLPEGLETIGEWAFYYSGLQSLLIPETVRYIGNWACSGMEALTAFAVDPDNPDYCSVEGVLFESDMSELVAYPAGKMDTEYAIPEGVEYITSGAFGGVLFLQQLQIPASVDRITQSTFELAVSMREFIVAEDNQSYCDKDGVLYTKDGKTLLAYPIGRDDSAYTVAPGTERIANSAFSYAAALTDISLPSSLLTIGEWAFSDCTGLTAVQILGRVTTIQTGAFAYCTELTECFIPASATAIGDAAAGEVFQECENLTIVGYSGTQAETYAAKYNIPFEAAAYPMGDINRDGLVTISDVILLNRIIAEDDTLPEITVTATDMDCNGDADVNVDDSVWILRTLATLN